MDPVIQYFVKSGISLAVFFLVYRLILRKETFFSLNRYFLIGSMILSAVIPFIRIQSPFLSKEVTGSLYEMESGFTVLTNEWTVSDYLLLLYIAGVAVLLIKFLWQLLQLRFLVRKYGITDLNGQKFVFTDNGFSDFTFFSLIFIDKTKLTDGDLDHIIMHERVHIEQYHTLDLLITELFTIVQWFNPFVWPYKRAIRETHEYLADNAVLAQGCDAARYQMLIFERFVGVRVFNLASNFHQSQIKRRIKMMQRKKSTKWSRYKALLILPVLSILVLAFARPKALFTGSDAVPFTGPELAAADYSLDDDAATKKEIKKLESAIADLKKKYETAETKEEKQKIKDAISKYHAKIEYLKSGKSNKKAVKYSPSEKEMEAKFEAKITDLKKMYKNTENEDKKAKIKEEIENLQKKRDQWRKENQMKKTQKEEQQ